MGVEPALDEEGCPSSAGSRAGASTAESSGLRQRRKGGEEHECEDRWPRDTAVGSDVAFDEERELIREKVAARGLNGRVGQPFALAFSGGGSRAAAFQAGILWRLAEVGCLRNVEHFVAVSGGCFIASAFASHLVAAEPPREDDDVEHWYRGIVAKTICRMQRNAGYWVRDSGDGPFTVREDGSGTLPPIFDLPMLLGLVLYTLMVNPITYLVVFLVPIAECVNFFMGTAMRAAYCAPTEQQAWEIFETWGPLSVWLDNLMRLVVSLFFIWLLGKLPPCRKPRTGSRKEAQWEEREGRSLRPSHKQGFLYLLSLRAALTRIVAVFGITILVLCISMSTELADLDPGLSESRIAFCGAFVKNDGAHPLMPEQGESNDCGSMRIDAYGQWLPWWRDPVFDVYRPPVDGAHSDFRNGTAAMPNGEGTSLLQFFAWPFKKRMLWTGSSLFLTVVFLLLAILVAALVLSPLFKGLFITCLSFLGPAVGLLLVASFVQYRVFGPLTGQYFSKVFGLWPFNRDFYLRFHLGSLVLAFVLMVFYHSTHFASHYYYLRTIRKAFFERGRDITWSDVRQNPFCPLMLLTASISDWKRPGDKNVLTEISISPLRTGSAKTGFVSTPPWRSVSKCTAVAAAALDAVFLGMSDRLRERFWNEFLNLRLGDYILFERFRNSCVSWCKARSPGRRRESSFVYEFPLVAICGSTYIVFIVAGFLAQSADHESCDSSYRLYVVSLYTIIIVFFCSFFGFVPLLEFFVHSPMIRQLHMLMRYIHVSETPPSMVFVSDGGVQDCTGVLQLMRRRCDRILLALAGSDAEDEFQVLRHTMTLALEQRIGYFYDPADPRRDVSAVLDEFKQDRQRAFMHLGIRYTFDDAAGSAAPPGGSRAVAAGRRTAHLLIVKNRLTSDCEGMPVEPLVTEEEILQGAQGKDRGPGMHTMRFGLRQERELHTDELGGCCCNCCHAFGCNCGPKFPHIANANQCLSPLLFSSLCRLGYTLGEDAIRTLTTCDTFAEPWEEFVRA